MILRTVLTLYFCVFINSFLDLPITNAKDLNYQVKHKLTRVKRQEISCNGFQCITSHECISERQKCDGIVDCKDGSDESKNCNNTTTGCVLPQNPSNGNWFFPTNKNVSRLPGQIVDEGTILKFQCSSEYTLNPKSSFMVCLNDGWNTDPPSCLRVCRTISSNKHTKVSCFDRSGTKIQCSEAIDGSYSKFECTPYYETLDERIRSYCVRGIWDSVPPQCIPVCGKKRASVNLLATNGTNEALGEYPWVAAVYKQDADTKRDFICGGSILTEKIILTEAYCVTTFYGDPIPPSNFSVAVGKYYQDYGDSRDIHAQYVSVQFIVVHPKYRGDTQQFSSDIALLITEEQLLFSIAVQPVCYRNLNFITLEPNEMGTVVGWGRTSTTEGPSSNPLQEITIPYKDDATCSRELTSEWTNQFLSYDKFCAGHVNKSIGECQADSGSGIVFKNNNRYYVHGILSLVKRTNGICDTQAGLYTRVSAHYDWLESTIANYSVQSRSECASNDSDRCVSSRCLLPEHPSNGRLVNPLNKDGYLKPGQRVAVGTIVKFECFSGYILDEENAEIDCLDSGWNKKPPRCINLCPTINLDENTEITCFNENGTEIKCSQVANGSYAKFDCAPYYESTDKPSIRTCIDGTWNLGPPQCVPVCGEKRLPASLFVVNGSRVERGNYPWTTALYEKDEETNEFVFICGGTMLTYNIILTAAHCVTNIYGDSESQDNYKIAVGKYFRNYGDSRDKEVQYSDIEKILVHPKYRSEARRYLSDIAILVTKIRLNFSAVVQPACYKNLDSINLVPNNMGVIAGWGYTSARGNISETLQEITVPYKDDATCIGELTSDWADKYLTLDKFCAGYHNMSRAVCEGDSGSGLVFLHRRRYYVLGIVSLSKSSNDSCNVEVSGLYTKVSVHYKWLTAIIANYSFESRNVYRIMNIVNKL